MFLKLHFRGFPIFVNMAKVYDFHEEDGGTRLHFDSSVAPNGNWPVLDTKLPRHHRHFTKDVDETPERIMEMMDRDF